MKDIHIAVGINPAGTTLVMKPIDAQRPHAFAPEKFLSELDRLGFDVTSRWLGDIVLRMLRFNHPATFEPLRRLAPPPDDPEVKSPFDGEIVAIAPFTYDGLMRPARVEIGILDTGDALLIQPVFDAHRGAGSELSLARLNAMGFADAARWVGQAVMIDLARQYQADFAHYQHLAVLPEG